MSLRPTKEQEAMERGTIEGFKRGYQQCQHDTKQFNGLTPAEHERLTILFEEAAEVTQVVGKILRHGYESFHPRDEKQITNRSLLETELGHLGYALSALIEAKDLNAYKIIDSQRAKAQNIKRYLHHQGPGSPACSPSNGDVKTPSRFDYSHTEVPNLHQFTWRAAGTDRAYRVCTKCHHSDVYLKSVNGGHTSQCTAKK